MAAAGGGRGIAHAHRSLWLCPGRSKRVGRQQTDGRHPVTSQRRRRGCRPESHRERRCERHRRRGPRRPLRRWRELRQHSVWSGCGSRAVLVELAGHAGRTACSPGHRLSGGWDGQRSGRCQRRRWRYRQRPVWLWRLAARVFVPGREPARRSPDEETQALQDATTGDHTTDHAPEHDTDCQSVTNAHSNADTHPKAVAGRRWNSPR